MTISNFRLDDPPATEQAAVRGGAHSAARSLASRTMWAPCATVKCQPTPSRLRNSALARPVAASIQRKASSIRVRTRWLKPLQTWRIERLSTADARQFVFCATLRRGHTTDNKVVVEWRSTLHPLCLLIILL
jgi:hypothetical protein